MSGLLPKLDRVMESALTRTRDYFMAEFNIEAVAQPARNGVIDSLFLRPMTSIICVGGAVDLFVAFSFDEQLIQTIYERMTEGMNIPLEEEEETKESVAGETVNIIIGHCTADLQEGNGEIIPITPPTVLTLIKTVPRSKNAVFHLREMKTEHGSLNIYLIGPRELFSADLEYVN